MCSFLSLVPSDKQRNRLLGNLGLHGRELPIVIEGKGVIVKLSEEVGFPTYTIQKLTGNNCRAIELFLYTNDGNIKC